ncbi:MAG: hypothetical protein L3J81_01955, partial [Thermoplasmata archaeon]|nr:hypothetical protein [Thermoplasmata archaeon]
MTAGPVPAGSLPLAARAPGKCILFGEHAVVHGRPELVLAIDLAVQVGVKTAAPGGLNGDPTAATTHPYYRTALEQLWAGGPSLEVRVNSRVPRAAGLGSSAAFCAAIASALSAARGGVARAELAQRAFAIERGAQGVGSPGDTAAAVGGGYLALNGSGREEVFRFSDGEHAWTARRVDDPSWSWVVAYSGVPRSTADAVRAVNARLAQPDGPALLDEFAGVAEAGIRAVGAEDRTEV